MLSQYLFAIKEKKNLIAFSCFIFPFLNTYALTSSLPSYEWFEGSQYAGQSGIYGVQNVPSASNIPGARMAATGSSTASGLFFFFGGSGYDSKHNIGVINDLWRFDPSNGNWTWLSGSKTRRAVGIYGTLGVSALGNVPGSRYFSSSWADASGNFWVFGGNGYGPSLFQNGFLNDLWKYDSGTGRWTWVGGSNGVNQAGNYGTQGTPSTLNIPSSRQQSNTVIDNAGHVWLYGGMGYDSSGSFGYLNDLWEYNSATNQWTWISGSQFANTMPVYGTQGVADPANIPGARIGANMWLDSSGNIWLFGGTGLDSNGTNGPLNDLWEYTASTGTWKWVSGSNFSFQNGSYGVQGTFSSSNIPGARYGQNSWKDSSGNIWFFGGYGVDASGFQGELNDLWVYNASLNQWSWFGGSNQVNQAGIWGPQGNSDPSYMPGSRIFSTSFQDTNGNLWLFGGQGIDANGFGFLNDLWKITIQ